MKKANLRRKLVKILVVGLILALVFANYCFATEGATESNDKFQNTKLVTGTRQLINDVNNWIVILAPVLTGLLVGYYLIRKSASEEGESRRWDNRIKVACVCCVGVVLASSLINLIVSYYQ